MDIIDFSAFRKKLASFMGKASEETNYLLSTPANARALQTSIEEAERGEALQRNLAE